MHCVDALRGWNALVQGTQAPCLGENTMSASGKVAGRKLSPRGIGVALRMKNPSVVVEIISSTPSDELVRLEMW